MQYILIFVLFNTNISKEDKIMNSDRELMQNIFFDIQMVINRHTWAEWRYNEKYLTYYNIMLIYEGEGTFIHNNKKYIVHRGDFVFYSLGDSRSISTNPNNLLKCYGVNFVYTIPIFHNEPPYNNWSFTDIKLPIDFITHIDDEHILDKLISMFDRLFRVHISNTVLNHQEERKIFIDILDLFMFSTKNRDINYKNKIRVDNIIKYMTKHFSEDISISDLAKQENISVSYLVRIFKSITNQTPITYLNNVRMNKAKQLLLNGCSVTETSEIVGFSDIYYFSKTFKKYIGINPSDYHH